MRFKKLLNIFLQKEHNLQFGLPILVPVLIEDDIDFFKENRQLIDYLTRDCKEIIKSSKIKTLEELTETFQEKLRDLFEMPNEAYRFHDNLRPLSTREISFMKSLRNYEHKILKNFIISHANMSEKLPEDDIFVTLSIPYNQLYDHLMTMLNLDCHLKWMDVCLINKVNYFNFIWSKSPLNASGRPPEYVIFYDLPSAKFTEIANKYTNDLHWNLEMFDCYLKPKLSLNKRKHKISKKQELFYICQFKENLEFEKHLNKEHHSIIDDQFDDSYKEMIKYNYKQLYGPHIITKTLVNLDGKKHRRFFYSALYRPINKDALFYIEKDLNDKKLFKIYEEYTQNNLKLVHLKAYKNELDNLLFITVFTNRPFYEGTSQLFIGLTKNELMTKIELFKKRKLYPVIITNYGYLVQGNNSHYEHLFAVFFCQL